MLFCHGSIIKKCCRLFPSLPSLCLHDIPVVVFKAIHAAAAYAIWNCCCFYDGQRIYIAMSFRSSVFTYLQVQYTYLCFFGDNLANISRIAHMSSFFCLWFDFFMQLLLTNYRIPEIIRPWLKPEVLLWHCPPVSAVVWCRETAVERSTRVVADRCIIYAKYIPY